MTRNVVDLTCKTVVELVTEYLGHQLSAADRGAIEQHLLVCTPCTTYVAQMNTVVALTGTLKQHPPAAPDTAALLNVFRRWKQRDT